MKALTSLVISCCLVITLGSCSSKAPQVAEKPQVTTEVSCIAVLPVRPTAEIGSRLTEQQEAELRTGAVFATGVIGQELGGNPKVTMISPAELNRLESGVTGGLGATVAEIGRQLGCDAVLMTTLRRFKQRQGGEMSVEEPASASFEMSLFDAGNQNVLWVADFKETQESLFANILSWGTAKSRGFRWITVEDLLTQGIGERLAECPYLK